MAEQFGRKYTRERANQEGLRADEFFPEKDEFRDYVEGKRKLNFVHKLLSSGTFIAQENEHGIATFILKKNNETIFDFKSLVPGIVFLTPTYWLKASLTSKEIPSAWRENPFDLKRLIEAYQGRWRYLEPNIVSVGRMDSPKEILNLLHEMGHANDKELSSRLDNIDDASKKGDQRTAVATLSALERTAWAEALKMVRKIKRLSGINLLEAFGRENETLDYIKTALATHRLRSELTLSRKSFESSKEAIDAGLLEGDIISQEDQNFLHGLFDKKKL